MRAFLATALTLALLTAACSTGGSDGEPAALDGSVEAGRSLWAQQRPERYRLTTRIECSCVVFPAWMDVVEGSEVVDGLTLVTGTETAAGPPSPRTMEGLYDFADELSAAFDTSVHIDPATGAIRQIDIDPAPQGDDDELRLVVDVTPLAPGQPGLPTGLPAGVELASLTRPLECNDGFGVTSADRTQSVSVVHFETPPIEPAFREVALPHHQWEVRVVVGETPAGAGCASATSAERIAEAHAVAGRLTVTQPGETVCDPVEIRIDDLEIEDGRGGRTQLGSVTVRGVFEWACDRFG